MKFKKFLLIVFCLCSLITGRTLLAADNTASNVINYSPSVNTELWIVPLVGQGTETVAATNNIVTSWVVPSKYKVLSIKARAEGFDNGTSSNRFYVDIFEYLTGTMTGATILTSPIAIGTASSSVTASVSDASIADESLLEVRAYGSGTSRATLQIYVERTN